MASEKTQRNNRETLQGLARTNEYQKSISMWRVGQQRLRDLILRILKDRRERKQVQSRELELFRDQFEFETGLDSREGVGKRNFETAALAHIERAARQQEARQEASAWREMQGPLAEGFDFERSAGDLPGDADLEAEILKQHPELKRSE
jgi:hypothetical protein